MLRVLFCMSCCSAPPPPPPPTSSKQRRSSKTAILPKDEKVANETNFNSLIALSKNEKDQLLTNQFQSNYDSHFFRNIAEEGQIIPKSKVVIDVEKLEKEKNVKGTPENSITASTSQPVTLTEGVDRYALENLDPYDEQSLSAPSSIDIEPFRETPNQQLESNGGSDGPAETTAETIERRSSEPRLETGASTIDVPSTSKIGDYARIEYSPVEDLESVTTKSQPSRPGSIRAGRRPSATTSQGNTNSKQTSPISSNRDDDAMYGDNDGNVSPLSSQGLPLGPQPDSIPASPETTGAALTSNSQESLSNLSIDSVPTSRAATIGSTTTSGGALVADSVERSTEDWEGTQNSIDDTAKSIPSDRVGSPQSVVTTTSGGSTFIANPTPTPSEMSGSGSFKKRKRLSAKGLLKKLKPGSSRRKNKDKDVELSINK